MSKMNALQNALNASTGKAPTELATPAAARSEKNGEPKKIVGGREGKENIGAWLPTGYKKSIRLVQAKMPNDPSLQDLMAEAFNDLFIKYNVPTVSE